MSAPLVEPSACTWCGIAQRGHGRQYADAVGYHEWERPSQEQILARMKARRLQLAVARAGALPVPVGPKPQADPVAAGRRLDLLALMDERAASVVSPVLAAVLDEAERLRRYATTRQAREEELLATMGRIDLRKSPDAWALGMTVISHMDGPFSPCTAEGLEPGLRALIEQLHGRIAELEAERHSTNEALDDAVQALRAVDAPGGTYPPALPWAALMDDEDRTEFLDELAESATVHASSDVVLAEVEKTCATWRLIAEAQHGHNTAPGPDAVTRVFSPVASLREPDGEFHSYLHHENRVSHDLPETGGAS